MAREREPFWCYDAEDGPDRMAPHTKARPVGVERRQHPI